MRRLMMPALIQCSMHVYILLFFKSSFNYVLVCATATANFIEFRIFFFFKINYQRI